MTGSARAAARASTLERAADEIPPASGAVVMGTGIVSVALLLDGHESLSRVVLAIAVVVWAVLGVLLPARALGDRERFRRDTRLPVAFTAVAGTEVLGTRLSLLGWGWVAVALLVIALAIWLVLIGPVLRHWAVPTTGVSFILAVGTESLALLASTLAHEYRLGWLLVASLVPFVLGLGFYGFVLRSFDLRQLVSGQGDHWVTGGALAISTVTAGRIALAAERIGAADAAVDSAKVVALVLWLLTMIWLLPLVAAEIRYPRLHYGVRRWSTVFPVGMYAACSFIVGEVVSAEPIIEFARVWVWIAVAVWLVVFGALLEQVRRFLADPAAAR